ncbi:hypothetical protein NQ318_019781 [Aromia moschata]|uniref:Uncharacterized protein n=1 Tax=Aromia moschata TaxID=1265417 RepID=A0AAV8YMJ6_9CUCU|nr:hypothetical protein NQ318_019781 [Aromia moschata]
MVLYVIGEEMSKGNFNCALCLSGHYKIVVAPRSSGSVYVNSNFPPAGASGGGAAAASIRPQFADVPPASPVAFLSFHYDKTCRVFVKSSEITEK